MDDDLKSHALNASHDFYELLGVEPASSESEIRRAYRKTALKYHPDKNAGKPDVIEKFHLLQIAYDVLSDPSVKELYDNARRARDEKKARNEAYEGRRKWMKEDLERRESGFFKRKREEVEEEEAFDRELKRLAADGQRRRKEREEQLRKELQEEERQEAAEPPSSQASAAKTPSGPPQEIDRTITLRFPKNESTEHLSKEKLTSLFARFGAIEAVVLLDKKVKVERSKHRQPYISAHIVYKNISSAHAAMMDYPKTRLSDPDTFSIFENLNWASGKEPEIVSQLSTPRTPQPINREHILSADMPTPVTPTGKAGANGGLKKVPSFASFKGSGTPTTSTSPHDITMIRLRNAERKRLEEKMRQEEAAAEEGEA